MCTIRMYFSRKCLSRCPRFPMRTKRSMIKWLCTVLVAVCLFTRIPHLMQICYYIFGHPRFFIVNPLTNVNSCQQRIKFAKRQIVDETLLSIYDLEKMFGNLSLPGGRFRANGCLFEERTAIIIPYRNRMKHLLQFLSNVLPKLLRQKVDFTIFVIEQTESAAFNRGMMRNIGFVEAGKSGKFGCFIFNDVDTIIEDDRNIYKCSRSMVRHMLSSTDKDGYWLPYYACMGGIVAFTTDQFQYINGYSNLFFMWGAEDDDLYRRVVEAGYNIERPPDPLAAVTKLKHTEEIKNKDRFTLLAKFEHSTVAEGLNTLDYKIFEYKLHTLFTWITVDIDERAIKQNGGIL